MKRLLLLLLFFLHAPAFAVQHEFKIYRKPYDFGLHVARCGEVASIVGLFFTTEQIMTAVFDEGWNHPRIKPLAIRGAASVAGIFIFHKALNAMHNWNSKKDKPMLIFDEEGFTYERFMGFGKERKDCRYLWKNVISHWVSVVINQYGNTIRKTWNYHISGEPTILQINVLDLDIPRHAIAKVESLRQGIVRALWDS
ncbi:MAG TPA: hypothetical protein VI521_03070 [Candidatus Babeliales bacterium]|nr:hypothetical protein [Candidatus Babeliales bacterium]